MADLLHDDAAVLALKTLAIAALLIVAAAWAGYWITRKPKNRRKK